MHVVPVEERQLKFEITPGWARVADIDNELPAATDSKFES